MQKLSAWAGTAGSTPARHDALSAPKPRPRARSRHPIVTQSTLQVVLVRTCCACARRAASSSSWKISRALSIERCGRLSCVEPWRGQDGCFDMGPEHPLGCGRQSPALSSSSMARSGTDTRTSERSPGKGREAQARGKRFVEQAGVWPDRWQRTPPCARPPSVAVPALHPRQRTPPRRQDSRLPRKPAARQQGQPRTHALKMNVGHQDAPARQQHGVAQQDARAGAAGTVGIVVGALRDSPTHDASRLAARARSRLIALHTRRAGDQANIAASCGRSSLSV